MKRAKAPRDVLPDQPKKERVLTPTPYPSAHVMEAERIFQQVNHGIGRRSWGSVDVMVR
jgi:hypothetical protein